MGKIQQFLKGGVRGGRRLAPAVGTREIGWLVLELIHLEGVVADIIGWAGTYIENGDNGKEGGGAKEWTPFEGRGERC